MRWFLRAGAVLALIAGTQLTFLTEHTDDYFFWTIDSPVTAAFLGATFWSAAVLALIASRQELWIRARLAVPAVGLVSTLLLVATLQHFDRFDHLISPIWVEVYVFLPPVIVLLLAQQLAVPGFDPSPERSLPVALRLVLAVQAVVMLVVGTVLLVAPEVDSPLWPWELTPLTSKAVGTWLVGIGATAAYIAWHDDREDVPRSALAYLVLGGVALAGLVRYSGDVDFGGVDAWAYVALALSWLGVGAYGTIVSWPEGHFVARARDRQSFFKFAVTQDGDEVRLEATVPRDAAEFLDFAYGASPASGLSQRAGPVSPTRRGRGEPDA
jgi:hypothetical protein